jgi:hypothetical protein
VWFRGRNKCNKEEIAATCRGFVAKETVKIA